MHISDLAKYCVAQQPRSHVAVIALARLLRPKHEHEYGVLLVILVQHVQECTEVFSPLCCQIEIISAKKNSVVWSRTQPGASQ